MVGSTSLLALGPLLVGAVHQTQAAVRGAEFSRSVTKRDRERRQSVRRLQNDMDNNMDNKNNNKNQGGGGNNGGGGGGGGGGNTGGGGNGGGGGNNGGGNGGGGNGGNNGGGQKQQYNPGDDDAYTWKDDDFADRDSWSNMDQFTYENERTSSPNNIYPPSQWIKVGCPNQKTCLGWPSSFDAAIGLDFKNNHCLWCPAGQDSDEDYCRKHHSSPINLYRDVAIEGDPDYNECIDVHWMQYLDSSCTFDMLEEFDAFSIERHGLKIKQPVEHLDDGTYRIACQVKGVGGKWGKIDFSRGFSQWWLLSHTDIHVPSEHTQQGKRYDGEIQLYHSYSIDTDGTEYQTNEMAALSIFLEAIDGADDYPVLNKLICQYRKVEEQTRRRCGLPSVLTTYPGCRVYTRGHSTSSVNVTINLGTNTSDAEGDSNSTETENSDSSNSTESDTNSTDRMVRRRMKQTKTSHDIMVEDYLEYSERQNGEADEEAFQPRRLTLDENEMDNINVDWDAFIQSVYAEEEAFKNGHRQLETDYTDVSWHNYFPMIGCKTEYYYRYSGTMTVPPCYGRLRLGENNRVNTNNWRVMKDPIQVTKRQIDELHRLIRSRIAPVDDPLKACRADTAAATPDPENPSRISVARPLQSNDSTHWMVFCECENWESKWTQDQNWCKLDKSSRFFDHPYNFDTDGF